MQRSLERLCPDESTTFITIRQHASAYVSIRQHTRLMERSLEQLCPDESTTYKAYAYHGLVGFTKPYLR